MTNFSSFPDYSQKLPEAYDPRFFDLGRFRRFLDVCGVPINVPAILIAGSKGKGTTAHILSRLLTAQGKKTGLFTSPYLYDVREMIRVDGRMIARKDFEGITREFFRLAKKFPGITSFEILTATALRYFSQKKADFYVLEVGLGGLLDAVNVVTPIATVLTMVEREHADILGETLLHIIRAKLGITRPGVPLFLGKQKNRVHELILKELRGRKVPVFDIGRDFSLRVLKMTEKGTHFQVVKCFSKEPFARLPDGQAAEMCTLQKKGGFSEGLKVPETFFLGLHGEAAGWNALTAAVVAECLASVIARSEPAFGGRATKQSQWENCHPERPLRRCSGQVPGAKDFSKLYHRKRIFILDPSLPRIKCGVAQDDTVIAVASGDRSSLKMTDAPSRDGGNRLGITKDTLRPPASSAGSLRNARNDSIFPGHFEIRNLPNGKKLILDVLHTPESARNFRQTLERVFPNQPYVFIAAFLQDKNVPAILKHLIKPRDSIFFAKISHPRAENPQVLYKFFVQKFKNSFQPRCAHCNEKGVFPRVLRCESGNLSKIFKKIAQSDCQQKIFCLVGSHFLLREAKKWHFLLES